MRTSKHLTVTLVSCTLVFVSAACKRKFNSETQVNPGNQAAGSDAKPETSSPSNQNSKPAAEGEKPTVKRLKILANRSVADGILSPYVRSIYAKGSTVYIGASDGFAVSKDGGKTFGWKTRMAGLPVPETIQQFVVSNDVIYAATTGGVGISTDGGESFVAKTAANGLAGNLFSSIAVDSKKIYVVNSLGLYTSSDRGATWVKGPDEISGVNRISLVMSADDVLHALSDNRLLVSTDYATTFTSRGTPLDVNTLRSFSIKAGKIYAATSVGLEIAAMDDYVFSRKWKAEGISDSVTSVAFLGSDLLVGTTSKLLRSTDGGLTFKPIEVSVRGLNMPSGSLSSIYVDDALVYIGTSDGLTIAQLVDE